MKRISVITLYVINILIFSWWQIRFYLENAESNAPEGGIIGIVVLLFLSIGLWYKPKIFRWISLVLTFVWTAVLTLQFHYLINFLNSSEPTGGASRMMISASILLCLSMSSFVLLLLPDKYIAKPNKLLQQIPAE